MPTGLRAKTGWDPETFTKTMTQRDRAATDGERAAAEQAMTKLARRAGLSLEDAIARVKPARPPHPFEEIFNSPAFKAEAAARAAKRASLRAEALTTYGDERAVWAPIDLEVTLQAACDPLIEKVAIIGGTMDTLQGWRWERYDKMPIPVREAVAAAHPVASLKQAWVTYQRLDALNETRQAFFPDYEHPIAIQALMSVLEHHLDTLPAVSMNDIRARLDWLAHITAKEWHRGPPQDCALVAGLKSDIERLWASVKAAKPDAVSNPDSNEGCEG